VSEPTKLGADASVGVAEAAAPLSETDSKELIAPPRYWVRVHGFPGDINMEIVYYNDFYDWQFGPLPGDPKENLRTGDVLIYFADGPSILYGVATLVGEPEGPVPDQRRGSKWMVPIKRDAIIRAVNKAPHAVGLEPPSGWHFIRVARDFTYIRIPGVDGPYFIEQVKSRASTRE